MRKLLWLTIGYAAAAALGSWLLRGWWLALPFVLALVLGAVIFRFREKHPVFPRILAALLGFAIGIAAFFGYERIYIRPAAALDGETVPMTVRVTDFGWETDYGTACEGLIQVNGRDYPVRLYLNTERELTPGDTVSTRAKLQLTDLGGDREPIYLRSDGVLLTAAQRGEAAVTEGEPGWREWPAVWRQRLLKLLDEVFPEETAGFARALLLGDKTALSHETSTEFSVTGISHVVAVSGLHVSILFSLIHLLSRKRRWPTILLGIPALLVFGAMAGFTASITRAVLMQLLMLLALAVGREYDPPTALAASCLLMLARCPLVITSVGFQLSVLSVAGIFLFAAPIRESIHSRLPGQGKGKSLRARIFRRFAAGVSVTLSATLMTAPLTAVYFHTVSLVGILTNLLVLPMVSAVFYGVMAAAGLGLLSVPLAKIGAKAVSLGIRYVLGVAGTLAELPLAAVFTESPYVTVWFVVLLGLILWAALLGGRGKVAFSAGVIGLCLALVLSWAEPLLYDCSVTVLDVGQGQCVILQSRGHTFMVDCGGSDDGTAADLAARTLLSQGITRIDGLVVTHFDRDHFGGVRYLSERIAIDALYLPASEDPAMANEIAAGTKVTVTDLTELEFSAGRITVFVPQTGGSDNEKSLSVLFQTEKCDTLITGDLSAAGERALLASAELPDLEVLIAGHHGSKNSTCAELLKLTAPDVAIISAGRDNQYGHPAQETLERLALYDCAVFRTDLHGTVTYRG